MCVALKDGNKSKSDKKKLKKQFRELKSEVHAKRNEFNLLKARKSQLKHEKEDKVGALLLLFLCSWILEMCGV